MNSIFVIIVHVIAHQPTEMRFVGCHHVIEDLAPTAFRKALNQLLDDHPCTINSWVSRAPVPVTMRPFMPKKGLRLHSGLYLPNHLCER